MSLPLVSMCFLATTNLLSGGSDSCANAEVIVDQGTFLFDQAGATTGTEGQNEPLCAAGGAMAIENDVWFLWTAPSAGPVRLYTCDQTVVDTKIAVYPGPGCPVDGTALACNDDTCGLQSTVEWDATAGTSYIIQIGNSPGSAPGSGSFELFVGGTAANNIALGGIASQSTTGYGGVAPRGVDGDTNGDWSSGTLTHTNNVTNSWWEVDLGGAALMSSILLYNRLDCCHTRLSNFRVSVFNGPTEVFGQDYYVSTGYVPTNGIHRVLPPVGLMGDRVRVGFLGLNNDNNGYLTLAEVEVLVGVAGTSFCPGDGIPPHTLCPCANNNDGSMGGCDWGDIAFPAGGVLSASGSDSMGANDTLLIASGVSNNFGIFFGANNQVNSGNGNPLNDGLRCAGGGLIRLIPPTMASGNQLILPMPVQTLDTGAGGGVTRRYQYWFRTPAGPCGQMANLTNGFEILWQP